MVKNRMIIVLKSESVIIFKNEGKTGNSFLELPKNFLDERGDLEYI